MCIVLRRLPCSSYCAVCWAWAYLCGCAGLCAAPRSTVPAAYIYLIKRHMQPKNASEGGSLYSILNLAYPYPRFECKTKTTRWCFFGVFLVCFWCVSDKNTKNTQMRAKTDIKTQPHSNFKWVFIPAFLLWSFYINVTGEQCPNTRNHYHCFDYWSSSCCHARCQQCLWLRNWAISSFICSLWFGLYSH